MCETAVKLIFNVIMNKFTYDVKRFAYRCSSYVCLSPWLSRVKFVCLQKKANRMSDFWKK